MIRESCYSNWSITERWKTCVNPLLQSKLKLSSFEMKFFNKLVRYIALSNSELRNSEFSQISFDYLQYEERVSQSDLGEH